MFELIRCELGPIVCRLKSDVAFVGRVIVALNLTAIMIRNRLREKYRALEN